MQATMRRLLPALLLGAATASGQAAAKDGDVAAVHFQNAQNQPVGEATLRDTPNGVVITVNLRDLPPGEHGFHIHAVGKCVPPFDSAGSHFNPGDKSHGFAEVRGPHAGDLPNLMVGDDRTVAAQLIARDVTLETGPRALLDDDGAALVVHSGPDDYSTDPAGASGARIACGIVERPRAGGGLRPQAAARPAPHESTGSP